MAESGTNILPRAFYEQPTLEVAKQLLGKTLVFQGLQGVITETEAYFGLDDPASHAFKGMTARNAPMFGPGGHAYIYLIYGMYHCFNITTEFEGYPAAVLLRGVWSKDLSPTHFDGPGKLCRYFGLTRAQNGANVVSSPDFCVLNSASVVRCHATPRIGIREGMDKLWRFVDLSHLKNT